MHQWNVRGVDAQGHYQILAIEAATQDEAAAIVRQRGLRVETVTPLAPGAPKRQAAAPRPAAPRPAAPRPAAPPPVAVAGPQRSRPSRLGTIVSLLLSSAALIVAIFALTTSGNQDPLGKGLDAYDLKTPRAAFKASLEMFAKGDIRAQIELQRKLTGPKYREQLKTLKIDREIAVKSKGKELVVLFASFDEDGKKQHKCFVMEKIPKTNLWKTSYYSRYTIGKTDKDLSKQMEQWEQKSPPSRTLP